LPEHASADPTRGRASRAVSSLATLAFVFVAVGPVYWAISTAFKSRADAFAYPPSFTFTPSFDSYRVLFDRFEFGTPIVNTVVVCTAATAVAVVVGSLAAYSLSRFRVPGGRVLMFALLSVRMFPAIALALPLYLLLTEWGLFDSRIGLIAAYSAFSIPIVVWMMRSFFEDVPMALDEAALMDGHSRLGVLRRVVVPLSTPGLVATATFVVILLWNEFLMAAVLTSSRATTVPVAITGLYTDRGIEWDKMAAAGSLAIVPVVVFTLAIHKYLVRGLTFGAVKG
jgi:ABC-type glycerol-3-phosphate transport system permease component